MAAAMNGIALHGGAIPYGAHIYGVYRLLSAINPPVSADGTARDLRDDA